jgi:diaminohydroxyphosphoribosylaminopyrimidine deaminase/5-amino-6-(5-phosphoribosylamino)uracil reductase
MMARALQLAREGRYRTRPNPAVGCVIAHGGEIIGEGSTREAGGNHAEIEALEDAARRNRDPRDATAYVTLEPCSHQGRTGPCCEALAEAGVARVVIAMQDPNPAVGGQGMLALAKAGIDVEVGLLASEAEAINPGFFKRMREGCPFVRIKLAASLDGRTAMASGESQWITGPAARADVQRLRGRSGAIITGVDTVIADDPALTVRDDTLDIPGQPLRVVLDSRLRMPAAARLLSQPGATLVACVERGPGAEALEAAGAEIIGLPGEGGVYLPGLLAELAAREVNEVLVECGPRLAGAFVAAGLVDELVLYTAPTLLGSSARPLLDLPIDSMAQQRRLAIKDLRRVGEDVRWTLALQAE